MNGWEDAAFLAKARAWIDETLAEHGRVITGEIEQPHVRPWSTVLRVPTAEGDVWFKAAIPGAAHDVPVTETLSRLRPDLVLAPLGVDLERGWMLLPDGGGRLRELVVSERSPRRWYELLPLYSELQQASVTVVEALVAGGVPDFRLGRLSDLAEALGNELGTPSPARVQIDDLCDDLAAVDIPETIQHDDLHDGNVFVRPDGRYAVFDWGDSCVTHPFASLVVCLRGIAFRFEPGEDDPDVERFRTAYLDCWRSYGSVATLERAACLAAPVGMLCRALTWWRVSSGVDDPAKSEYAEASREWYEEFAATMASRART